MTLNLLSNITIPCWSRVRETTARFSSRAYGLFLDYVCKPVESYLIGDLRSLTPERLQLEKDEDCRIVSLGVLGNMAVFKAVVACFLHKTFQLG